MGTINDNSLENQVKRIFAHNPTQDTLFITSDDRMFYESTKAQAHSVSLRDKNITAVERTLLASDEDLIRAIEVQRNGGIMKEQKGGAEVIDPENMTNKDLKKALDELGIEYPSKANKADLVALLNANSEDEGDEDEGDEDLGDQNLGDEDSEEGDSDDKEN